MDENRINSPPTSGVVEGPIQLFASPSREDVGSTTRQVESGRGSGEEVSSVGVSVLTAEGGPDNGAGTTTSAETTVAANLARSNAPDIENVPGGTAASRQSSPPPTERLQSTSVSNRTWKSWKIRPPCLSLLLSLNAAFVITILSLDSISKSNHGFVGLGDAPGFLARDPSLEQAIWAQGIFYTALPAFIMTLFQTSWHAAVAAFAKRQPYVDLKAGGPARQRSCWIWQQVYRLSSHKSSTSALVPHTIIESAQAMFTTMYSIFANQYLLQPTDAPTTTVGTTFVQPTRLIVVSPIAYIIVSILLIVALLNMAVFVYERQDSILDEEPVGLLGAASILHGSKDIEAAVRETKKAPTYENRVVLTALDDPSKQFNGYIWTYKQGKLVRDLASSSRNQNLSSSYVMENLPQEEGQRTGMRLRDINAQPGSNNTQLARD
ncbi:uncharacterized protein Z519_09465 [Cladophialophora bantiana CBS 173.52]|uniref:Uncharacterized protein n=1 Tax=Cladophialophora bantiana (strain ATCC 10958 / CBS 173.52 / CDC B-1940 / NIH 8579) TaxID=1442370 RepID=A0A0D2HH09_CLAB1|nr:uncharacterized protein Z519_09465 [Cladophialophora bantiana CBS 173.52]KIW90035.1 hypothetical protein Z519_09465 [Cladophialophora bantiana CBS 173.52]